MREPYGEGVAGLTGPKSCGGGSNAAAEQALFINIKIRYSKYV